MLPPWLVAILACPLCHQELEALPFSLACRACQRTFPIGKGMQLIDFFPRNSFLEADPTGWQKRQEFFRDWLAHQDEQKGPEGDDGFFSLCARYAGTFDGNTLDVGGGNGYLGRWLPTNVNYVCLDPEEYHLARTVQKAAEPRPAIGSSPLVLRGVGEHLPFKDECFRAVFSLGTLNHTSRPEGVIREISRVLQPGGALLLTIEEVPVMVPIRHLANWRVVKRGFGIACAKWLRGAGALFKTSVQPDHIRVHPRRIAEWLGTDCELQRTFFTAVRGTVEMGQVWRKTKPVRLY